LKNSLRTALVGATTALVFSSTVWVIEAQQRGEGTPGQPEAAPAPAQGRGRGRQHLHDTGHQVVLASQDHLCLDALAGDGPRHEDHLALVSRDALAAEGDVFDVEGECLWRGLGCGHEGRSSWSRSVFLGGASSVY